MCWSGRRAARARGPAHRIPSLRRGSDVCRAVYQSLAIQAAQPHRVQLPLSSHIPMAPGLSHTPDQQRPCCRAANPSPSPGTGSSKGRPRYAASTPHHTKAPGRVCRCRLSGGLRQVTKDLRLFTNLFLRPWFLLPFPGVSSLQIHVTRHGDIISRRRLHEPQISLHAGLQ